MADGVKIKMERLTLDTDEGIEENEFKRWHMSLKDVYRHAFNFYKEKEGKALHLTYEDKLKLVAFTQQVAHGPFNEKTAPQLGVLDVIGRDRRAAWLALANTTQVQAMSGFVHMIDRLCPLFKTHIDAIVTNLEAKKVEAKREEEDEKSKQALQERLEIEKQNKTSPVLSEEERSKKIKEALNAQSYDQFLEYAQQQYPGNFDQQAILIRQLQDQHYHQYMQQLAINQRLSDNPTDVPTPETCDQLINRDENAQTQTSQCQDESDEEDDGIPQLDEATMWTRKEITTFKSTIRDKQPQAVLVVPDGSSITIRVPTLGRNKTLYWEFATDYYDIAFGVYFEWSKCLSQEVSIHVSDSEDDDDPDNDNDVYDQGPGDLELGDLNNESQALQPSKPAVSVIVPIYRRDSHLEVYCGSHTDAADGVYLLKFDNTYSLWRSKTVYYRVYYTQ